MSILFNNYYILVYIIVKHYVNILFVSRDDSFLYPLGSSIILYTLTSCSTMFRITPRFRRLISVIIRSPNVLSNFHMQACFISLSIRLIVYNKNGLVLHKSVCNIINPFMKPIFNSYVKSISAFL